MLRRSHVRQVQHRLQASSSLSSSRPADAQHLWISDAQLSRAFTRFCHTAHTTSDTRPCLVSVRPQPPRHRSQKPLHHVLVNDDHCDPIDQSRHEQSHDENAHSRKGSDLNIWRSSFRKYRPYSARNPHRSLGTKILEVLDDLVCCICSLCHQATTSRTKGLNIYGHGGGVHVLRLKSLDSSPLPFSNEREWPVSVVTSRRRMSTSKAECVPVHSMSSAEFTITQGLRSPWHSDHLTKFDSQLNTPYTNALSWLENSDSSCSQDQNGNYIGKRTCDEFLTRLAQSFPGVDGKDHISGPDLLAPLKSKNDKLFASSVQFEQDIGPLREDRYHHMYDDIPSSINAPSRPGAHMRPIVNSRTKVLRAQKHTLYPLLPASVNQYLNPAVTTLDEGKIVENHRKSSSKHTNQSTVYSTSPSNATFIQNIPKRQEVGFVKSTAKVSDCTLFKQQVAHLWNKVEPDNGTSNMIEKNISAANLTTQDAVVNVQGTTSDSSTLEITNLRLESLGRHDIQAETISSRYDEMQRIQASSHGETQRNVYTLAADKVGGIPSCVTKTPVILQEAYNRKEALHNVGLERSWSLFDHTDSTKNETRLVVHDGFAKFTSEVLSSKITNPAVDLREAPHADDHALVYRQRSQENKLPYQNEIDQHLPITTGLDSWQCFVLNMMHRLTTSIPSDTSLPTARNVIPMYQTMRTMFEKSGPLLAPRLTAQIVHSLIKSQHPDLALWFLTQEGIGKRDLLHFQDDIFHECARLLQDVENQKAMIGRKSLFHGTMMRIDGVPLSLVRRVGKDFVGELIGKMQVSPNAQDLLSLWQGSRKALFDTYDQNPTSHALHVFQVFLLRSAELDLGGEQAWVEEGHTPLLCACMEIACFVQTPLGTATLFVPLQRVLRRWIDRYRSHSLFGTTQARSSDKDESIVLTQNKKTIKILRLMPVWKGTRTFLCHHTSEVVSSAAIPYLESFLSSFSRDYVEHILETLLMQLVGPEPALVNTDFNSEQRERWFPEHLLWMFVQIADRWKFKPRETLFGVQGSDLVKLDRMSIDKVPKSYTSRKGPLTQLSPFRGVRRSIEHLVMMRRRSTYVDYLKRGGGEGSIWRVARFFIMNWVRHRGWRDVQGELMKHLVEQEMLVQSNSLFEDFKSRKEYYKAHSGALLYGVVHVIKNLQIEGLKEISQNTIDLVVTDLIIVLLEYDKITELMSLLQFYRLNGHKLPWSAVRQLLRLEDTHLKEFEYILLRHIRHYPDVLQNIITTSADVDPARAMRIYHILTRVHHQKPSKNLLINMARKFAISNQLSPRQAQRRVLGAVNVSRRLGYPPDVRMGEALAWTMVMRRMGNSLMKEEIPMKAASVKAGFTRIMNIAKADDSRVTRAVNSGRVTSYLVDKLRHLQEESNKLNGDDRGPYDQEMQKWILANKELTPDKDKVFLIDRDIVGEKSGAMGAEGGGEGVEVVYARNRAAELMRQMNEEIDRAKKEVDRVIDIQWKRR